jgi:2-methylcitrate dehydratase PrpD
VSLARQVATVVARTTWDDVPTPVLDRARHLVLDAVGLAFAASAHPFADTAAQALGSFGHGDVPVLGSKTRLPARDAAVLNGVLVHGLDFDDTHIGAVTHVSASALPAAISAAVAADATTRDLLLGYVLGVEVAARVGLAGAGAFHDLGFHPTALAGAFGSAVAAGSVTGLAEDQLVAAQGVVGSMAAGLLEFLEDGSWTKRLHPGWAAQSGITAAAFAKAGWSGPEAVYEGRFGLFATHLAGRETHPELVAAGLGERWETAETAVKPYPICHFAHAFADAVLLLREQHDLRTEDVAAIRCAIHPVPGKVVCEPAAAKWEPRDEYDAKFSLPYVVSTALARGRFTLAELEDDALRDPEVLALARKVEVVPDPDSAFPAAYSGWVQITTTDGRVLTHREQVNRGHADRPLTDDDVVTKFRGSMAPVADEATTERVLAAVLSLGREATDTSARTFAEACAAG